MFDWRRYTSEGYVLAFIPVLGWFAALYFEKGYADYYSYPVELIAVDMKSVLLSLPAIVLYISLISQYFDATNKCLESGNPFYRSLGKIGMFCLVPLLGAFIVAFDRWQLYLLLATFLLVLCFLYLPPVFGKGGTYAERLSKEVDDFKLFGVRAEQLDVTRAGLSLHSRFSLLICFGILFCGLCYGAGGVKAKRKKIFYLYGVEKVEYVVLAAYGDLMVYSRLEDGRVTEDILVKNIGAGDRDIYKKIELAPGGGK